MARNKKNQSAVALLGVAVKAGFICLLIVLGCLGYVWQKNQIRELSRQRRTQEEMIVDLRGKNDKLRRQLAGMLSPAALEQRAIECKLGLVPPQPMQVWRLPEPAADSAPANDRQYAASAAVLP